MIKSLRLKLVVAAMLSLLAVLGVILGVATTFNYRNLVARADSTLALLAENGGQFPEDLSGRPGPPAVGYSPELPFESRYFTVVLTGNGTVVSVNTGKIAAVDTRTAVTYAQAVLDGGKERGFLSDFRFIVRQDWENSQVIFLDRGRDLDAFRAFVHISIGVSAAGLAAVLVLLTALSERIVRPFSEAYEKQKRFITDAGHELKTPLTIINADAEVLAMDLGENEWLTDIRTQTERLAGLTNDLIFLARMEEGQPTADPARFSLSDAARETVETFRALAVTRQKTLTGQIQPEVSMVGDEKAIRRLLTIFLDNAMKYSDENGTIALTLARQKHAAVLTVTNTTQAMDPEDTRHLFERFYRTDRSRNSQTGGYGLGLSIAAAIVAAHHGKIAAHTEDGASLTITVTLPISS